MGPVSATTLTKAIWAASAPTGMQAYVAFRKIFELAAVPESALIHLFADTRYRLWINGQWVEDGPCRFDPRTPAYDTLDVTRCLRLGPNAVAVLVHHYALNTFTEWFQLNARMMHHDPGLALRLDIDCRGGSRRVISVDSSWRTCARTRFRPSPYSYSSVPDNIDCRLEHGDWTQTDFDDSTWEAAVPRDLGCWGPLRPRPIPLLRRTETTPERLVRHVVGGRTSHQPWIFSWKLPLPLSAGDEIILEVDRAVQAYSVLELDAEEGAELEVDYGVSFQEGGHLITGRPWVGGISRYVARAGRQTYVSGDTYGFKYLTIRVKSGEFVLHRACVIDRRYPFERIGRFECDDSFLNKVWDFSVNTVELCSEDAIVDCADRERAQWLGDGVMVEYPVTHAILAGPGVSGAAQPNDLRLFKKMLRDVATGQLSDGRLQPMRPSDYPPHKTHGVIEDFSCLWVQGLRDLYERTGDGALVLELLPTVKRQMDQMLRHRAGSGLLELEEYITFTNPLAYQRCQGASINAYACGALRDAARLCGIAGDMETAARYTRAGDDLKCLMNELLWDASSGSYHAAIRNGEKLPPTAHAAILSLYQEVVPMKRRDSVARFVVSQYARPQEQRVHHEKDPFPLVYAFYFHVLYRIDQDEADCRVLELIRRRWPEFLREETQTTCEGSASNNLGGNSPMHNYGAVPAFYLSCHVLGVRSEGLHEQRRLVIQPRLADLRKARGTVLTEYGMVTVAWERRDDASLYFRLLTPPGKEVQLFLPVPPTGPCVILNGKAATGERRGRWVVFNIEGGQHEGRIERHE